MIQRTFLPALLLALTLGSASVWANPAAIQDSPAGAWGPIAHCTIDFDVATGFRWFPWLVERNDSSIDIESNDQRRWILDQNWIDLNPLMIRRVSGIG